MLGLRTHPLYESPTTEVCPLLRIAPAEFKGGIKEKTPYGLALIMAYFPLKEKGPLGYGGWL
jgi:hypothetical protein